MILTKLNLILNKLKYYLSIVLLIITVALVIKNIDNKDYPPGFYALIIYLVYFVLQWFDKESNFESIIRSIIFIIILGPIAFTFTISLPISLSKISFFDRIHLVGTIIQFTLELISLCCRVYKYLKWYYAKPKKKGKTSKS